MDARRGVPALELAQGTSATAAAAPLLKQGTADTVATLVTGDTDLIAT